MADLRAAEKAALQVGGRQDGHAGIAAVQLAVEQVIPQRDADGLHGDFAHIIRGIAQEQPLLHAVEGDGLRGADGGAQHLACCTVNAGGDVHGDDGRAEVQIHVIGAVDEVARRAGDGTRQPRAEEGVHDHVAAREVKIGVIRRDFAGDAQIKGLLPVQQGVAVDVRREFHNMRGAPVFLPQPGSGIAVAAVVAGAAQEYDLAPVRIPGDGFRHAKSGVLHQKRAGDVVFGHEAGFQFLHFSGGDGFQHGACLPNDLLCFYHYTSSAADCKP